MIVTSRLIMLTFCYSLNIVCFLNAVAVREKLRSETNLTAIISKQLYWSQLQWLS